jgi:hypothetical protein
LAFYNWGRGQFAEPADVRAKSLAPFTQQSAIRIDVRQDEALKCDSQCQHNLGSLFAEAISVWRGGCTRCNANALVLIELGNSSWLDWRLERRLRSNANNSVPLDLSAYRTEEDQLIRTSPSWAPGGQIVPFADISGDRQLIQAICKLPVTAASWVPAVQSRLCGRPLQPAPPELRPVLYVKNGATACGLVAVACGLTYGNVEINAQRYRYTIETNAGNVAVFGGTNEFNIALDVWPVILHEVGHWFGVPHSEIAGKDAATDVMNENYNGQQPCVSGHSLIMLNNGADMRWPYRVTGGGGLGPPQVASPGR